LDKLYESLKDAKKFDSSKVDRKKIESFKEALEDDFNTSKALKILQKISQDLNSTRENKGTEEILSNTLKVLGNIIGIFNDPSQDYFQYGLNQKISNEDIEKMIAERNQARLNKDFKKADLIREKLFSLNIILEDDGDKTIWKKLV
jgi:cysteinyl-tRNA synthetase